MYLRFFCLFFLIYRNLIPLEQFRSILEKQRRSIIEFSAEDIYHALLKKGLSEAEIDSKIKEISSELSGYITDQAALYLLAKEYGLDFSTKENNLEFCDDPDDNVDYDEFLVKISDILPGDTNIVLVGKILKNFGGKTFVRKDGSLGKVGSFLVQDDSGAIKVVLWDEQSEIIFSEAFQENVTIRIIGSYAKGNKNGKIEVHLNRKSKIEFLVNDTNNDSNKNELMAKETAVESISGVVSNIIGFKEIDLKNGTKTFLLKFVLTNEKTSITVLVWDLNAIYFFKSVKIGDTLKLSNLLLKFNVYSNQNELIFKKNSSVEKILE